MHRLTTTPTNSPAAQKGEGAGGDTHEISTRDSKCKNLDSIEPRVLQLLKLVSKLVSDDDTEPTANTGAR